MAIKSLSEVVEYAWRANCHGGYNGRVYTSKELKQKLSSELNCEFYKVHRAMLGRYLGTWEQKKIIEDYRNSGISVRKIAEKHGISVGRIYKVLDKFDELYKFNGNEEYKVLRRGSPKSLSLNHRRKKIPAEIERKADEIRASEYGGLEDCVGNLEDYQFRERREEVEEEIEFEELKKGTEFRILREEKKEIDEESFGAYCLKGLRRNIGRIAAFLALGALGFLVPPPWKLMRGNYSASSSFISQPLYEPKSKGIIIELSDEDKAIKEMGLKWVPLEVYSDTWAGTNKVYKDGA